MNWYKISKIDWSKVDWSKRTKQIADELGSHPTYVSNMRMKYAPETTSHLIG